MINFYHSKNHNNTAYEFFFKNGPLAILPMQKNKNQHSLSQPSESKGIIIDSTSNPIYEVNERVFHQKFGYGYIVEIDADSAVVCFDKAGNKKVKASYLFGKDNLP